MNIKIKINKWFNKYKLILSFIAIVIILFLLVMRGIDGKLEANNNSSSVLNTATIVENVENKNIVKNVISESKSDEEVYSTLQNLINSPSKAINIFIELCNNKKTALAYNMLSDECKIQLYPTEEEFINKYYNKIFNTPKLSTISIYNGNSYKVEFNEDSIITGRASEKNIEYITVKSDYKLNLSSFIQSNKINSSNQNEYLKLEVLKKHIYLNYEEYEIKIQNLTKADIYIDDIHNSQIYIADSNNKIFKLKD